MKVRLFGLFLGFLYVFATRSLLAQYAISGVVVNAQKKVLKESFVFIQPSNKSVRTQKDGRFFFKNLQAGQYELLIDAIGFQSKQFTVEISNKDIDLKISLDSLTLVFEKDILVNSDNYYLNPAVKGVTLLSAKTVQIIDLQKIFIQFS